MKPIYKPKGAAAEYGEYAVNIYSGCPHRCFYCFSPQVLHMDRETFHTRVEPREGIVSALRRQLEREQITGKLIHLCFTCDPYPEVRDTTATREVIQALKEYGNHVQILTKGDGSRDFDLLDSEDWYGVTVSCGGNSRKYEPFAIPTGLRLHYMKKASENGIKTWVSFEPVLDPVYVLHCIRTWNEYIDRVKIGKLNYHKSSVDWAQLGREAEALCKELGLDYYIKNSLRAEMDKEENDGL